MKRNIDLIRKILMLIEECEDYHLLHLEEIEGYEEKVICYHLDHLKKAGMISCIHFPTVLRIAKLRQYEGLGLTWTGHDFLDSIRNDSV